MRCRLNIVIIVVITTFWLPQVVNSAEQPTIEERLIRLEEGQKRLGQRIEDINGSLNKRIDNVNNSLSKRIDDTNKRIDDLRKEMNTRFSELRQDMNKGFERINQRFEDMNQRFGDMNQRIGDLQLWFQIAAGILLAVLAGLIAHIIWIWKRLTKVETRVNGHLAETEKDRLIVSYREEIEELKAWVNKLKTA